MILLAAFPASAPAKPFIPSDDGLVLETALPNADPRVRQMRDLASELKQRPGETDLAVRLAGRQLAMGVAEADPRFVGYAEATLAPWWRLEAPDNAILLMRARIEQAQHRFTDAAADLRALLGREPNNLTALLTLASVDEVMGNLAEAARVCETFAGRRPGLAATACIGSVGGVTGQAAASLAALAQAVDSVPTRDVALEVWALTILAEIAARIEDPAAEAYFNRARGLDERNVYLLTAFADYLLAKGRGAEVLSLLRRFERFDPLSLRLALAAQATHSPLFGEYRADVGARLAAARRQGDQLHLRDAAIFVLRIDNDPQAALGFAQLNWVSYKAPADARVLAEAAVAARDPSAAAPVAEFVMRTRLEDDALNRALTSLGLDWRPHMPR